MVCKTMYGGSNPPGTSKHRVNGAFFISFIRNTMADNYLEKKMEQHKARVAAPVKAKGSVAHLLDKCSGQCAAFGDYEVRIDQLRRAVAAAAKVTAAFSFKLFVAGDAVALRSCLGTASCTPVANGYIMVCAATEPCDSFLLGRVVQAMFMQLAEIGLSASLVSGFKPEELAEKFSLPFAPVLVVAVGRSAEPSLGFEVDVESDNLIIQ